jgi:hypothetical protein
LLACLLLPSLALAADPDWVRSGGSSVKYPVETYLTGFAMAPDTSVDAAKTAAAGDLATRITVRIESETSALSAEKNGVQSYAVSSLTRASSDVRLSNLAYETFVGNGHAYALAYRRRDEAAEEYRELRDRSLEKAKMMLDRAERAEKEGQESLAIANCYTVRLAVTEAAQHHSTARAIAKGSDAFNGPALLMAAEERIQRLLKRPSTNVAEAVATLALQLKQQGVAAPARWTVAPLTFGTTSFSSAFGRNVSSSVERALAEATGKGTVTGDLAIKGTYLSDGDAWRVALVVREVASGMAVASAEVTLPKKAVPGELATLPANFEQALKDEKLLGAGEAISGDLRLELWTNKGRSNLVFTEQEEMSLHLRVNRPAYVRLIYMLADGKKVVLEQAYFIDASKVNQAVEYPDKFEVSAPFGVERIYAVAFTEKPEPVPVKHQVVDGQEYDLVAESTEGLVKHRGLKKKAAALQTAEATVAVTTTRK